MSVALNLTSLTLTSRTKRTTAIIHSLTNPIETLVIVEANKLIELRIYNGKIVVCKCSANRSLYVELSIVEVSI